ncbi:Tll0287-like domain-containing protein [Polaribacter uvawellassae]|uniref:Tll0287-like domain-containing protein n=1 Tax=Polaribacter uvawellassae TaxID=3133495 RepID=UPI00321ACE96
MRTIILVFVVSIFVSCQTSEKPNYSKVSEDLIVQKKSNSEEHPGKKLMEINCYVCHSPSATHQDRIAPPMIAVKRHYISSKTTKEEFKAAFQKWIENPTEENSKMRGAVRKFGVMPKTPYPTKTIDLIADYLFDNEIDKPKGFDKQHKKAENTNTPTLSKKEIGLKYALSTKAILGKNLMGTIQKEGTIAALKFCNEKAFPLTDSMAVYHSATIKRVSNKPRNLANLANFKEKEYIEIFKKDILENKESEPIIVDNNGTVNFYYPIKTNGVCLQCHGKPNVNIKKNTLAEIKKLYPKDKAIGYDVNDVRGIWSISFKE